MDETPKQDQDSDLEFCLCGDPTHEEHDSYLEELNQAFYGLQQGEKHSDGKAKGPRNGRQKKETSPMEGLASVA